MELLVLGGTSFAGRHVVERALAEGHAVTTFNRGRTNPDLFPAARALRGDRSTGDYAALESAGPFDAVVDMCAYVPRAVREAVGALGPSGLNGPYVLISSVSAYAELHPRAEVEDEARGWFGWYGFTEESPLAQLPAGTDPSTEDVTPETYGPLKALTEGAAEALLPDGLMIVRPGLIVGPHDPTDRFTYWVRRMVEGGRVLAPESPDLAQTHVIDAADMARWIVASASAGLTGTYNAVAPPVLLHRVLDAAGSDADVVWVPWEFLEAEGVRPWTDLPAWVPVPMWGLIAADASRAANHGLHHRPIEDVVAGIAAWDRTRPREPLRAGMSREREAELLARFTAPGRPPGP